MVTVPVTEDELEPRHEARGRIAALDGLRGVAIVMVLAYHLFTNNLYPPPQTFVYRLLAPIFGAGWVGVDLFFVLSGFLITGILVEAQGKAHAFRNFYARRALRIFPLYYFALTLLFFAGLVALKITAKPELRPQFFLAHLWLWTYTVNWVVLASGMRAIWLPFAGAGHFWSLAVEEQFYLIWPMFMLRLSRRTAMRACGACIALAIATRVCLWIAGARPIGIYMCTLSRLDALAIGGWVALYLHGGDTQHFLRTVLRPAAIMSLAIVTVVVIVRHGLSDIDPVVQLVALTPIAIIFAAIVAELQPPNESWFDRAMSGRALQFLGRYSYGLYVWHWIAYTSMAQILHFRPEATARAIGTTVGFHIWACSSIAATFIAAILSYHVLELPFLRMKHEFSDK